jgi:hypothetical protein
LTLGLGIGATVSVFSIIYAVMIQPRPYRDPARLVSVFQSKIVNDETDLDGFSPAAFLDFRQQSHAFTHLAAYCDFHYYLTGNLTGVGLFAVVSYLVRERTKELGLRMVIGASRSNVMNPVLRQSLKLALLGTASWPSWWARSRSW